MKNFFHNFILSLLMVLVKWGKEPRLKKWMTLETYKDKILKAVENRQPEFPQYLLAYLSTAFHVPASWIDEANWERLVFAFYTYLSKSPQVKLPLTMPSNEKHKEESWDYEGRLWHLYSHLLAKNYGWTLKEISRLQVNEALAKIQEILVDEQIEREFYYGLSEAAYSYDQRTKKSKFVPLPRPVWMRPKVEPEKIRKFSIPASMLPVGMGHIDGILPPDFMPKEISETKTQ